MTVTVYEPQRSVQAERAPLTEVVMPWRKQRRGPFAVLRSVLFWSHLALGLAGGVVILVMSVTGALLGFEKQIIARVDGVAQAAPPSASAVRLPLDSLFAAGSLDPASLAGFTIKAGATEPVAVRFRARNQPARLLDPYTGAVIPAVPRGRAAEAMAWLRGWHRWLGAEGERRAFMRKLTGVSNIAFLLLVFSGLYLWWPKRLSKAAFRTAAVFNPTLQGKPRDFNWHNSLGFWSAIPLAVVVASGVFISYAWPGQWMDRLLGSESERAAAIKSMNTPPAAERAPSAGDASRAATDSAPPRVLASLGAMLAVVQQERPEWQAITVTTAGPRDSLVQFAVSEGNTYRPDQKRQYYFNAESGAKSRVTTFDSLSTSRKIRGWTRFGHTGEIFGVTGQTIATIVSVVGAILVYTGIALAWRRMMAFIRRRSRTATA